MTADFEYRHCIMSTFSDFDLSDHILLSLVSPFRNRKFPTISLISGFSAKIEVSR